MDALTLAVVFVATMVNPAAVWLYAARLTVAPGDALPGGVISR
jgi:hypothetical protein